MVNFHSEVKAIKRNNFLKPKLYYEPNTNSCNKNIIIFVINIIFFHPIPLNILILEAITNNKLKLKSLTCNSIYKLIIKMGKKLSIRGRYSPPLTPSARVKAKSFPLYYHQYLTSKGERTIIS